MKKEDLFRSMSELDQSLIAETKEEGVEVKPIRVAESKSRIGVKSAAVAAACCVLLAGAVAVGLNRNNLNIALPLGNLAESTAGSEADRAEPGTVASIYPENAKYQYKGDYSEIKEMPGICIDFVKCYDNYRDILNDCDLAVVGEFIDDPWQDIDPDGYTLFYPEICNSYNRFKIDTILGGEGETATVLEGSNIIINQRYAVNGKRLLADSNLTPMLKGDRWVYFLRYNESDGTYYPLNDYMGRYPEPGYCRVDDRDPDIRETANQILPFMDNKYGLFSNADFNENIYRTLTDILCHEAMLAVECLYDSENLGMYNVTSFEMAEFTSILFTLHDGVLRVAEPWSSVPGGVPIIGGDIAKVSKLFLTDLNGDGKREICAEVHWDYGSEVNDDSCIYILDYADNKKYYTVSGKIGETEYYLAERDEELIAYKTQFTADSSRGQVISDQKLALDMEDCFSCVNMRGHNAYCLQDADYCAQQEGECQYRHGKHHDEDSTTAPHGHSEYCLQDAAYCAQQEGECPYRHDEHHDEDSTTQPHGHSEYCLQDAEYCAQQEGECPYRHDEHHDEDNTTVPHGHSEYCLQDAAYCAQQEGECQYRQSQGQHHDEDHGSSQSGHH